MKYFTYDLWCRINSESTLERQQADMEWDRNREAYGKIFETVKPRLTKRFLKMYQDAHGFHDCDFS